VVIGQGSSDLRKNADRDFPSCEIGDRLEVDDAAPQGNRDRFREELLEAIRTVHAGKRRLPAAVAQTLTERQGIRLVPSAVNLPQWFNNSAEWPLKILSSDTVSRASSSQPS
jgi:hypothetical protein